MLNDPNRAAGEALPASDIMRDRDNLLDGAFVNIANLIRLAHGIALDDVTRSTNAEGHAVYQIREREGNQLLSLLYVLEEFVETVEAKRDAMIGDPMTMLCGKYHREVAAYEAGKAGLDDAAAQDLYDRTIEPVRDRMFRTPPAIKTDRGAAEAMRVALEDQGVSGVELSLLRSVSTYLDGRASPYL